MIKNICEYSIKKRCCGRSLSETSGNLVKIIKKYFFFLNSYPIFIVTPVDSAVNITIVIISAASKNDN